jgi:hypothetical protein
VGQRHSREASLVQSALQAANALNGAHMLFVHQSVGENVMDGVAALEQDRPGQPLRIVDLKNAVVPETGGFFAHARLGRNGDPRGKTDAFVKALEGGLGDRLDVAFQKYCFVDVDEHTDVDALFDNYRAAMIRVHREFPRLRIVHVTVPLVHVQSGPKAVIKRWIGRTPDHYEDNFARERYNTLMRREYAGREPVFDIAALESSRPGQPREAFRFQGRDLYELRAEYTTDGAHLNANAAKRVASELLILLSDVVADHLASAAPARR